MHSDLDKSSGLVRERLGTNKQHCMGMRGAVSSSAGKDSGGADKSVESGGENFGGGEAPTRSTCRPRRHLRSVQHTARRTDTVQNGVIREWCCVSQCYTDLVGDIVTSGYAKFNLVAFDLIALFIHFRCLIRQIPAFSQRSAIHAEKEGNAQLQSQDSSSDAGGDGSQVTSAGPEDIAGQSSTQPDAQTRCRGR